MICLFFNMYLSTNRFKVKHKSLFLNAALRIIRKSRPHQSDTQAQEA
jgi:hypothetical protein